MALNLPTLTPSVPPTTCGLDYQWPEHRKGKRVILQWRNLEVTALTKAIKVNAPSGRSCCWFVRMWSQRVSSRWYSFPKPHNLCLIMMKTPPNLRLGYIVKITWPVFLKMIEAMKNRERWKKLTEESQLRCHVVLWTGFRKDIRGNWQTLMKSACLVHSNTQWLVSQFWQM